MAVSRIIAEQDVALGAVTQAVLRRYPKEAAPTVTFNGSAMSGAVAKNAIKASTVLPDLEKFGIYGVAHACLIPRATSAPGWNFVTGALGTADTAGLPQLRTVFYTTAQTFDIIQYGTADKVTVYVNRELVGFYSAAAATGTAQAGGAATITLAAGASATNGFYNQFYARITGGTGSGQTKQITGYVGATKVATVASNWSTPPDATSTYSIEESDSGIPIDGNTGTVKYLNFAFTAQAVREITVVQTCFAGVNVGPDAVWAAPSWGQMPLLVVADSIPAGTASPQNNPTFIDGLATRLGVTPINLSSGGTGFVNKNSAGNRLNFYQRIAPPTESWRLTNPSTAGTFTLSVTYGGSTQTTGAIAFNASATTIQTALNALSNVPASSIDVARNDINTGPIIVMNSMSGATLSVDSSGLTAGPITSANWPGDVALNQPKDTAGNPLPFILLVVASGNDSGYTDLQVQTNAVAIATAIPTKFPTAQTIFTGVLGVGGDTISASDLTRNAAIRVGAALLPTIAGQVPFIDTYDNGLNGNCWMNGAATVAAPTSGKLDFMKSITVPGHPTGLGQGYLESRLEKYIAALLNGNVL